MNSTTISLFLIVISSLLYAESGKKVFESYCWGCHHQTATAFGPSFKEIASKRSAQEIKAMITDPESVSKEFGYKRNAMPKLNLKLDELDAITKYILSYKEVKKEEENITKEQNRTLEKGLYYMLDKYILDKNDNKRYPIKKRFYYHMFDKYMLNRYDNGIYPNYMFYFEDNRTIKFEIIEEYKTIEENPYPNIASKEHY